MYILLRTLEQRTDKVKITFILKNGNPYVYNEEEEEESISDYFNCEDELSSEDNTFIHFPIRNTKKKREYNNISANTCNILEYLYNIEPSFIEVDIENSKQLKMSIFWGLVQSGKTRAIMGYIILCLIFYGITPVVLFHNDLSHPHQFDVRFTEFLDNIISYGRLNNKFYFNRPNIVKSTNIGNGFRILEKNSVIYALNNSSQIKRVLDTLINSRTRYSIIQDESDISAKKNKDCKRDILRIELLENSSHILGCTATPYAHFFDDSFSILPDQFIFVPPPSTYKGFEYCTRISIGKDILDVKNYNILPDWLLFSINHFENNAVKNIKEGYTTRESNVLLFKITISNKKHYNIQDSLKIIYNKNPSITFNDNIVRLFFPKFPNFTFHLNRSYTCKKGYYIFKGISLMESLSDISLLLDSINSSQTVFVIGGKKLDRGLSITSSEHTLYANGIIYNKSKTCRFATVDQGLGRVFGVSNDNNQRFIYSTDKIFDEMKHGYDVMKTTYNMSQSNVESNMCSIIRKGLIPNKLNKVIMSSSFSHRDQLERSPLIVKEEIDIDIDIDCDYRKIKEDTLALKSKSYYDMIIITIINERINEEIEKSSLIELIGEDIGNKISSSSWQWHKGSSKNWVSAEPETIGLLFRCINKIWYVRYNK